MARSDFEMEVECAARTIGAVAVELEDALLRLPAINSPTLRHEHPHELVALWRALCEARARFFDLAGAVKDGATDVNESEVDNSIFSVTPNVPERAAVAA